MNQRRGIILLSITGALLATVSSCVPYDSVQFQKQLNVRLADTMATRETVLLFHNLKEIAKSGKIIFGHQNSTEYGVFWRSDSLRSDVKDVCGSYPGVYGWDFESIPKSDSDKVRHRVPLLVRQAYERGGINTFSWHIDNPITGRKFYDTTIAVRHILPGGTHFHKYLRILDTMVEYTRQMVDKKGNPIPIIFRPYHEFDGSWFWWGRSFCTREEFIKLWQITVEYLRHYKKVNNFLYAYSPDRFFITEEEYLERYPGDEYVDILGMDNYFDFYLGGDSSTIVQKKLIIISTLAARKNKIAAFTETGQERVIDSTWFTKKLYPMLDHDSVRIAYIMVWRNANPQHFYIPFPGHSAAQDFIEFRNKPRMLFEDDLPPLYHTVIMSDLLAKVFEGSKKTTLDPRN
ncbi:MAG: glycoside hydrolase family 26 protein [Bacteroidetes bacterium]|nr:glycoside hydrolase family 26 protein [Bacteroidota bacterium]